MGIVVLISFVAAAVVLIWALERGRKSEIARLQNFEVEVDKKIQVALEKISTDYNIQPDQIDSLLEKTEFLSADGESNPHFCKKLKIFRSSNETYWLGIFYSDAREGLVQKIPELRARRALFLHPREYQLAFGAYPHRDQLKPLLENSMQSKLERFNPDLHADEMFAVEPIGREFGAKIK